jgi:hypothetical protein
MTEMATDTALPTAASANRRQLLARAGLLSAAAVGAGLLGGRQQGVAMATEVATFKGSAPKSRGFQVNVYDILNFALNLEYLEAEFYLRATTGAGIPTDAVGANPGTVTGGTAPVPFVTGSGVASLAASIAADELAHVRTLRSVLGARAVDRPTIDFTDAFNAAATAAGITTTGQTFDPFSGEDDFLLGAFLFEDVGVTAYHGAIPYIASNSVLIDASGILAVEAYHAGAIRANLYLRALAGTSADASNANAITALRETASNAAAGPNPTESQLASSSGDIIVAPTDSSSAVAFSRTFSQVLNIVYLNTTSVVTPGGFFPQRLNGRIA